MQQTLALTFDALGIKVSRGDSVTLPTITAQYEHEWGYRLLIKLPSGVSSADVIKQQRAISEALRADIEAYWKNGLVIDVFTRKLPAKVLYVAEKRNDWKVPIGVNRRGETRYFDFAGPFPHLLTGGIAGGGKSVISRGIITSLVLGDRTDLYLCDLKGGVELGMFRNFRCTLGFADNLQKVAELAERAEREMNGRYAIMAANGSQDWHGRRLVFVMDEMADLKTRPGDPEADVKNRIKSVLTRISAKGRAAGVILMLSTQRPSADVIDGLIKTNIATSISFKTRDGTQSRIIIDSTDAADLPDIPGRCIYQQQNDEILQTFLLSYEDAKKLLANCEMKTEENVNDVNESQPGESLAAYGNITVL
ncbi:FtsK/SpoIIIE domain-containing protein [Paenibacillus gansuensis]|uniref:FtsK/SpoIIIE domain-containing protein n=1 Tax=Paenibacillus gansuensis TaxID=306542 RepID=A0ABW5PKC9_9BACL